MTGAQIEDLGNQANYVDGVYNTPDLQNFAQIAAMKLMTQFNDCNYTGFLVQFDQFFSNIPQFAGTATNLITQVITGYSTKNTAVFISVNDFVDGYNNDDWNGLGQAFQLFLAQAMKYKSPDSNPASSLTSK